MAQGALVLLVEDDASLQRFVSLVLATLPLELHCCETVDEALGLLETHAFQLLLTDLMLPGRSGFELIETLAQTPESMPRIVVFSAGLSPAARARLELLPVWRLLDKPSTVAALEACVRDALLAAEPASALLPADRSADAAARNFGGNQTLHDSYRAECLRQFTFDVQAGDAACGARDAEAMHRLAHNLKSVLLLLGHEAASAQAGKLELELAASTAAWDVALPLWRNVKGALLALE